MTFENDRVDLYHFRFNMMQWQNGMRSFWKVAAFRLTGNIRIQSGRRALRCFQNELHHFIILNLKWYYSSKDA